MHFMAGKLDYGSNTLVLLSLAGGDPHHHLKGHPPGLITSYQSSNELQSRLGNMEEHTVLFSSEYCIAAQECLSLSLVIGTCLEIGLIFAMPVV